MACFLVLRYGPGGKLYLSKKKKKIKAGVTSPSPFQKSHAALPPQIQFIIINKYRHIHWGGSSVIMPLLVPYIPSLRNKITSLELGEGIATKENRRVSRGKRAESTLTLVGPVQD